MQSYSYWQKSKWIAGVAIDPVSKKPNFFANGSGSLTTYEEHPGDFKIEWYQNGDLFLRDQYKQSNRTEVRLCIVNDSLAETKSREELALISDREIWIRPAGSDPEFNYLYDSGKVVLKNKDIRLIPPMMGPVDPQIEIKQIKDEWKIAYPKRRKAFLDQFEKIMIASSQTWKSLNIEFIRDDVPWPKS